MAFPQGTAVQDWIQDFYSPILSVLATEDAEAVTFKNNLSVTELLQPFSKVLASADLGVGDADGTKTYPTSLNVILQDFKKDLSRQITQKVMLDRVSEENCRESEMVTHNFEKLSVDIPGSISWFDVWMKHYLHSLPVSECEFLKHVFGCIFVVSSTCANPVEKLRGLVEMQHRHQHEQKSIQYFAPNIMKCFILLHDCSTDVPESTAQSHYNQMQSAFGPQVCHILKINSRDSSESSSDNNKSFLAQYWLGFSHRFFSTELRRNISDLSPQNNTEFNFQSSNTLQPPPTGHNQNNVTKDSNNILEHPLAMAVEVPESPPITIQNSLKLTKATAETVAVMLSDADIGRIQLVIREIIVKSVIPFAEKQIKSLHEIASNKKSRGLFAGAKRWFGNQKGMAGAIASVGYAKDAPELQIRKLADIYFLMNMFKPAYTHYYNSKKDFQQDEAWTYYAPAVEMTALSMFMMSLTGSPDKKYRADYMEDAVAKYLTVCQATEFAVRATLFDALCLKQQGLFTESANSYIKMTNELSDLRSAMLLEQAAYCFLQTTVPSLRKYGFHIVLAGYRFTKTGSCKEHAVRLYIQGSQVYDRKGWLLSSENILYTLGHQKFMLKEFSTSAEYFNNLMAVSTGRNHLQQMVHLREYFLVFHARYKENKNIVPITIPKLLAQQVEVSLVDNSSEHQVATGTASKTEATWHDVEKAILNGIKSQEIFTLSQTCQQQFNASTHNNLNPQAVVGETIYVNIPFENNFPVGFQLKNLNLIWKFTNTNDETFSSEKSETLDTFKDVRTKPIDICTLEPNAKSNFVLKVCCYGAGMLNIVGVEYLFAPMFPDREPTDHQIRGKQYIQITAPKMNTVQDHKTKIVDGQDNRLNICVRDAQPFLQPKLKSPLSLFTGELKCVELILTNTSNIPLSNIHIVCSSPGLISFGKPRSNSLFELPLIQKPEPPYAIPTVSDPVREYMDLIPVPLPPQMESKLAAGATVNLPLWIRGRVDGDQLRSSGQNHAARSNLDQVQQVNECLYFYYENANSDAKFNHRISSLPLSWKLYPSLEVKGEVVGRTVVDNKNVNHVEMKLKNEGNIGTEGHLEEIVITQVSLMSRDNKLHSLELADQTGSVLPSQILNLAFKTCSDKHSSNQDKVTRKSRKEETQDILNEDHSLRVSSVGLRDNKCHAINSPPFLDFLKQNFDFGSSKKPPSLKGDIAVIMWRCNSSQPVLGQTVVQLQQYQHTHQHPPPPGLITSPRLQPVKIKVEHPDIIKHDFFSSSPFVSISITLHFRNITVDGGETNNSMGTLVQYRVNNSSEQRNHVVWSGVTDGAQYLSANMNEGVSVQLSLNVHKYGLYNIKNLEYRACRRESADYDYILNCDDQFSCIDLCFSVLPP